MPTEHRFEDLDLCEEPARRVNKESDGPTLTCYTFQSVHCTGTADCSLSCCQ